MLVYQRVNLIISYLCMFPSSILMVLYSFTMFYPLGGANRLIELVNLTIELSMNYPCWLVDGFDPFLPPENTS